MSRETYETYSAEPEKIDLIAFLAEYFQAFRKFFLGVLILVILMGGGSFLTAKLPVISPCMRHTPHLWSDQTARSAIPIMTM